MRWKFAPLAVLLAIGSCGRDIRPKELNEPCTRTEQCVTGLVCLSGVCLEEAGDGGTGGMGGTGGAGGIGGGG